MLVSMDMSMRSSGLVAMTPRNEVIGFEVIKTTLADFPDHEDMMIYVAGETMRFINEFCGDPDGDIFVIEGLSHGAKSGSKDVIAGLFWFIRSTIWTTFPKMPIGAIPVTSWRSKIVTTADKKFAKENYSPKKDAIKIATVKKLPADMLEYFTSYIEQAGIHKDSIYDLTDAYFLGVYRNSL